MPVSGQASENSFLALGLEVGASLAKQAGATGIFDTVRKPGNPPRRDRPHTFSNLGQGFTWSSSCHCRRGGASLSYKVLQLSPQASTRVVRTKITIQDPWC